MAFYQSTWRERGKERKRTKTKEEIPLEFVFKGQKLTC